MQPILAQKFLGNSLQSYLTVLAVFLGAALLLKFLSRRALHQLKLAQSKTPSKLFHLFSELGSKAVLPLLYLGAFYFSSRQLRLSASVDQAIRSFALILLTFQLTRIVLALALHFMEESWFKREAQTGVTPVSKSILTVTKVVIWAVALTFLLDNLGFNVSAVVAGLGIGGVAVALAAQTILGDLFNYFVIFFDKPFEEGDFVIVDDYRGTIEHVGIKSTRIRSAGGEQIVISNSNLTSSRIRNYKRMHERRVSFKIGVVYETPLEQLKKIPVIMKQIIEGAGGARFDRSHFKDFGDFSLNFEVVYNVLTPDYVIYMDIQQKINLAIKEAFEREGIEFAYPTQVAIQKQTHN